MIIENIASLNLHDSELISAEIRTTDERDDNILLHLDYLLDYESFETKKKVLIFRRCWGARFDMHFRYSGSDRIYSAKETTESSFIDEIKNKYATVKLVPTSILRHFVIATGLSGSQLDVVAEELHLVNST